MGLRKYLKGLKHKPAERAEPYKAETNSTQARTNSAGATGQGTTSCNAQEVSFEPGNGLGDQVTTSVPGARPDDAGNEVGSETEASPPPQAPEGADVSKSAYFTAWASLEEPQRAKLGSDSQMLRLFEKLDEVDEAHYEKSRFARGLNVVAPYLKGVGSIMEFTGTLASLHPIASTTHGIVKSSITARHSLDGIVNNGR